MDSQILDMINAKLESICSSITELRKEITTVKADLAIVKTDVAWLKKLTFITLGVLITALIGGGIQILLSFIT